MKTAYLSFSIQLPSLPKYIFYAFHIREQLSLNLPCPDDGASYWRQIAHLRHMIRFRKTVLSFELVWLVKDERYE